MTKLFESLVMELRNSARRETDFRIRLGIGELSVTGTVKNVSWDGALVHVDGAIPEEDLDLKVSIEALDPSSLPEIKNAGKLVRIFETPQGQFLALRFLDYMAT